MRRVKAYIDGKLDSLLRAEAVTETTRHAWDYECIEPGCQCRMHWRKAVYAKGNTRPLPPTFVKNKSSAHKDNCPRDVERIVRENSDYTTLKNGHVHIRVNFPLGSAPVDRAPLRGWLSQEQVRAAENQKDIQPFSSLKDVARFLEKQFGSIESDAAGDVMICYQGRAVEWSKLFKPSDRYDKLFLRATTSRADHADTAPVVTVVRPVREIVANEKGKRRFECEDQHVRISGRRQKIIPVLVCGIEDPGLAFDLAAAVESRSTILVSARPFYYGEYSVRSRFGEQRISLALHTGAQIAPIGENYWKLSHKPGNQLDLFGPSPLP